MNQSTKEFLEEDIPFDENGFVYSGNAEADKLINALFSSDPDFEDCARAAAYIWRSAQDVPQGYSSWKEAATAERLRRVRLEDVLAKMKKLTDMSPNFLPNLEDTREHLGYMLEHAQRLGSIELLSGVKTMMRDNERMIAWAKEAVFVETEDSPTLSN